MSTTTGMPAAAPAPSTLKLILTLAFAGLFSGLAIVGIYEVTLPRITANKAAALKRAVFEVVPGSERMERMVWADGALVNEEDETIGPAIYAAFGPGDALVGYAMPADGPGFQDNIKIIYGFDPVERRVVGMAVLESRETPGLGDRIFKDQDFVDEFKNLAVDPEVVLIKGTGEGENEVDAITGATISSKAVVKIINASNETWLSRIPAGGEE
jgi:electron transport complex protein RnfG